jgi:sulfopyruvate decarboxylase subunit alpha
MTRRFAATERARSSQQLRIDHRIVDTLANVGIDFCASVPCGLLDGVLQLIAGRKAITQIPVTREEEGVGLCAGAYLGGAKPALLMQNSGLGNSINALLSLTRLYHIGLLLVIGYRGRLGEEQIEAQMPMGAATTKLLDIVQAEYTVVERESDIERIATVAEQSGDGIGAVLLTPQVWK